MVDATARADVPVGASSTRALVAARLVVAWVVLVSAEVFSGASLGAGLWNPWTVLVTYWLYFAHFFLLTTLAIRTGRTSLSSLFLWGVLFGLYESWLTKVIWHGYSGDGKFILGQIGPYGYSEISMVILFHPVMSFIVPLAVACVLFPPLRCHFPELAWFTGASKGARTFRVYLVIAMGPIMAVNSGGPVNLAANLVVVVVVFLALRRMARDVAPSSVDSIVTFRRIGFAVLCVYLAAMYGAMYFGVRYEGLPSIGVQWVTVVFYALAIAGLAAQRRRDPSPGSSDVSANELRIIHRTFSAIAVVALSASAIFPAGAGAIAMIHLVIWPPLGVLLSGWAIVSGFLNRSLGSPALG